MKYTIAILFLIIKFSVSGQDYDELSSIKFWIYGNDTGYAIIRQNNGIEKEVVERVRVKDTIYEFYLNGNLKGKGTATHEKSEKIIQPNGKIKICKTYSYNGIWEIYYNDSIKRIAKKGRFLNHKMVGEWTVFYFNGTIKEKIIFLEDGKLVQSFDTLGNIKSIIEYSCNGFGDTKIVAEINFRNGKSITVTDESTVGRIFHKNAKVIMIIFFLSFFGRIPINHVIYNRQERKRNPLIWIPGYNSYSETLFHGIRCMWTFWWFKYDSKNKALVYLNLIFSVISVIIFLIGIIAAI